MRALVLVLALSHTWAAVATDNCDQIKAKRLTPDDLDAITGDWVVLFGTFGESFIDTRSLKSIHLEFNLQANASSMSFTERVMFNNEMCWKLNTHVNLTADSENTFSTFNSSTAMGDTVEFINDTCQMTFYKSSENCMFLEYKGIGGHVLFSSRREGHHQNIQNRNETQTKHDELANCLGITDEKKYTYDGAADFCPKSSS